MSHQSPITKPMTENKTYEETKATLCHTPRTWLITGVAGFIGSHLAEQLLLNGLITSIKKKL